MKNFWIYIGMSIALLMIIAACTPVERDSAGRPVGDPTGRVFNPALSCVGHCTGYAESGDDWCFCDKVCPKNGNCCSDFKTACTDTAEGKSTGAEGRVYNPSLSCAGHCTGFAESGKEWCFCDAVCEQNKNCCSDFKSACSPPLSSEPKANPRLQTKQLTPPDTGGLIRAYPDFIKCSWVSPPELPEVVQNIDELKQLGLNAVCVMQGVRKFDPATSNESWESMKLTMLSSIVTLKKSGFAIVFVLDAGGGPQAEKEYTKLSIQQFLDVVEEEALAWATLAEEYQVEYFAPANELSSKLHNLLASYSESERQQKKNEETNKWHKHILPKVREIFKGKAIAKLGDYSDGLNSEGYDVVAYTIGHSFITDLEKFRQQKVKATYDNSVTQSKSNNAEWLVGEIYFAYEEAFNPNAPPEYTTQSKRLQELQDDYHRIIIEEIDALPQEQKPKGLAVGGYSPGSPHPTLTEESKEVIKKFFTR